MRDASLAVLREIGVDTGGSNVQFAVNPENGRMIIIEMNPRVSRSSALASKATGFPIAKVAAKLAVGYTLDELRNEITGGVTPASFEPSIDYVVTKVPRFTFEKFAEADPGLTTQMKSVGEVMAIGRTFQESLQKALRGLETGMDGLNPLIDPAHHEDRGHIQNRVRQPTAERLWYVADAFRAGWTQEEVFEASKIDPWFLAQIAELVEIEQGLAGRSLAELDAAALFRLKQKGFSDRRLATLLGSSEGEVRARRWALDVHPVYKRVDTCAAEFASTTAYMYSTYEEECEAEPSERDKIVVLGGGPNRIGQGIEFDYCCVHAAQACREDGFETIMVNCNPETVSTDYDTSDRLYFEPLTLEDVLEVIHKENPKGVIVQYGGQTPLKLARDLEAANAPIIGTTPDCIDLAEDRERFQQMLQELGLKQPPNRTAREEAEAVRLAAEIGYPLVVRPSYVLGGRAMERIYSPDQLADYFAHALAERGDDRDAPVLIDQFLAAAVELDVDVVADRTGASIIGGVMEHIEEAGIHSGDSACSLPPYSLDPEVIEELERQARALAGELGVVGLMNVQFAVYDNRIYVIEVNPRASRTVPFVSKATGLPLAKIATRCMVGRTLEEMGVSEVRPEHVSVKESVFPFVKFGDVDTILGPEMRSTGEVMGIDSSFAHAFSKAQLAADNDLPTGGTAFISLRDEDKPAGVGIARRLKRLGFDLVATHGTAQYLRDRYIDVRGINKVLQGHPHCVDAMENGEIDLVVNTTEGVQAIKDSKSLRRAALLNGLAYFTTVRGAQAGIEAIGARAAEGTRVAPLQRFHRQRRATRE